jgi:vancomycin resistance protein VanW
MVKSIKNLRKSNSVYRLAALLGIILLLASCSANYTGEKPNKGPDQSKKETPQLTGQKEGTVKPGIEEVGFKPPSSGKTASVPWENDEKFKNAIKKSNTPIFMAAFQTVLKDPLPGEEYNVHLAASILAGIVLEPGQVFSQNGMIGPYSESKGFKKGPTYAGNELITTIGGGVCKISSTLYNIAVLCNLDIIERHSHAMPVPYVPYGQDATVSYGDRDFRFKNTTTGPLLIWAQGIDNILYMAFYGGSKPPEVIWNHEKSQTIKPPVILTENASLPPKTEKTVQEGMEGAVVKSWVTIKKPDGTATQKQLGKSIYEPLPQIMQKAVR